MDFDTRYNNLNDKQRQAVDTIDGPVMVVAGPGTGKTELLSMRAANILRKTDTLPENILCLTFTDSGAHAMRERLASIIGKDAYKVAIHTFHSFGSEVINQNGEYFYSGANFRPADELAINEIITNIFNNLEYNNPLASKNNGTYTHLKDAIKTISELKRAGLTSDELLEIINANEAVLDATEQDLQQIFTNRISKSTREMLEPVATKIAALPPSQLPAGIPSLSNVLSLSLQHALEEALETNSTKPITAWRDKWLEKNKANNFIFKDRKRHEKLRAMSYVYFQYLSDMHEAELYDFDDMILKVVHALEVFDDLRFNLQEKFQYIMVDEFQDTNLAQMRILANLTNNPAQEDTPNILVVGDDDQAIYSFQGADVSNILSFRSLYPKAELITLVDNYRSGENILAAARQVIQQGAERLENHIDELDKTLSAHQADNGTVQVFEAPDRGSENYWIVDSIKSQLQAGKNPDDIAVLTRQHREIIELLPYFAHAKIDVAYERRDNVFELESVIHLELLARVVDHLAQQRLDDANALLPELLAHPMWQVKSQDIWRLSLKAYQERQLWLSAMSNIPSLQSISQLLIALAQASLITPLEQMLDYLNGKVSINFDDNELSSPLYGYFFDSQKLADQPEVYLRHLEGLRTIREAMRDHQVASSRNFILSDFLGFIDSYRELGKPLTSIYRPAASQTGKVNLMTAHKSKGLEFDTVYIANAVDSVWGEKSRSQPRLIGYPENLSIKSAGNSADERLRLFFVALTRAKTQLFVSYSLLDDKGKNLSIASFLSGVETSQIKASTSLSETEKTEIRWYENYIEPAGDLKQYLEPVLEKYKLSTTHLASFLDVTRGGPRSFLANNLLRFPQAMSPASAFGSAIHETLQRAHSHLNATGKHRATEDVIADFSAALSKHRLSERDHEKYLQKGIDSLQVFLDSKYGYFHKGQKPELDFASQQAFSGRAHLTGKLDLLEIDHDNQTITVTDYKTGKPAHSWHEKQDYEKIKLHRYKQQLMFYKIMIEASRDYGKYTVKRGVLQFVEPNREGEILALESEFSSEELEKFKLLVDKVWQKIINLDLPDTSVYEPNFKGILQFEQDLLDEII